MQEESKQTRGAKRALATLRRQGPLRLARAIISKAFEGLWINQFHKVWYSSHVWAGRLRWLGAEVQQSPMDTWVMQEIIYETRPDFIIETGTNKGGSALFFASIMDLVQHGEVVTIDTERRSEISHPRVLTLTGDSTSTETVRKVSEIVGNGTCMVFLDSAHNSEHVLKEMNTYSAFVGRGHYLIVADTNLNGHPVDPHYYEAIDGRVYRGGPMEAVEAFLASHPEFVVDQEREKNLFTQFPRGFLLRTK